MEPMLASCTVVSTPSSRQRDVSIRLTVEESVFHLLDVPRDALAAENFRELRPEELLAFAWIFVEARFDGG